MALKSSQDVESKNNLLSVKSKATQRNAASPRRARAVAEVRRLDRRLTQASLAAPAGRPEERFVSLVLASAAASAGDAPLRALPVKLKKALDQGQQAAAEKQLILAHVAPELAAPYLAGHLDYPSFLHSLPFAVASMLIEASGKAQAEMLKSWGEAIREWARLNAASSKRSQKNDQEIKRVELARRRLKIMQGHEKVFDRVATTSLIQHNLLRAEFGLPPVTSLATPEAAEAPRRATALPAEVLRPAPQAPPSTIDNSVSVRRGRAPAL